MWQCFLQMFCLRVCSEESLGFTFNKAFLCSRWVKRCKERVPEGYTVFRKDGVNGQNSGGVFQVIKGDIITTHRVDLDTDFEIIWSQCQMAGRWSKSLFLASFYRPHPKM